MSAADQTKEKASQTRQQLLANITRLAREAIYGSLPAGSKDASAFEFLLDALPLEERRTQAPGDRHVLEDATLAFDPESDYFLPTPWQVSWGMCIQIKQIEAGRTPNSWMKIKRRQGFEAPRGLLSRSKSRRCDGASKQPIFAMNSTPS